MRGLMSSMREIFEWLMDELEDLELKQIVIDRANERESAIEINIDDL